MPAENWFIIGLSLSEELSGYRTAKSWRPSGQKMTHIELIPEGEEMHSWSFPENLNRKKVEEFLRTKFGVVEAHLIGFRKPWEYTREEFKELMNINTPDGMPRYNAGSRGRSDTVQMLKVKSFLCFGVHVWTTRKAEAGDKGALERLEYGYNTYDAVIEKAWEQGFLERFSEDHKRDMRERVDALAHDVDKVKDYPPYSFLTVDWGDSLRGHGRRSGEGTKGAMSDPPRGVKEYRSFDLSFYWEDLPNRYKPKSILKDSGPIFYWRARVYGLSHWEACYYSIRKMA
jgi:hypothetical protein